MTIKENLRLLDMCVNVHTLHTALQAVGLTIEETEISRSRYGLSTRDAVSRFQQIRGFPDTGLIDGVTRDALSRAMNERVGGRPTLELGQQPFRKLRRLETSIRELADHDKVVGSVIHSSFSVELKNRLKELFDSPSTHLNDAIDAMEFDFDAVSDMKYGDFVIKKVVPELLS